MSGSFIKYQILTHVKINLSLHIFSLILGKTKIFHSNANV